TSAYGTNVVQFTDFIDSFVNGGCGLDGGCARNCASPDPDCPCAEDGFCTELCTDTNNDRDCPYGCSQDGYCAPEGCPKPDPDCPRCDGDGKCAADCSSHDPDCVAVGSRCDADEQCDHRICLPAPDEPRISYCTRQCDPEDADCPAGMTCESSEGSAVCMFVSPTPGAFGSVCASDDSCITAHCLPVEERLICTDLCQATACPQGYECWQPGTGQPYCVPGSSGQSPTGQCAIIVGGRGSGSPSTMVLALFVLTLLLGTLRYPAK
ncbi:MAG: hypothetical protein V2A73_12875, partial [Pseudomonadota bacterium]